MLDFLKKQYDVKQISNAIRTAVVVLVTLLFCLSMTIPAKQHHMIEKTLDLFMLLCILYGVATNIIECKAADVKEQVLIILYFISRVISYKINDVSIQFGGTLMLQAFYLIGICRRLYGGKKKTFAALHTFLMFDIFAVLLCFYNYYFRKEHVAALVEEYMTKGISPQTSFFQNPNYAGMMTGAAIVLSIAIALNNNGSKRVMLVVTPIVIINVIMLFFYTGCRSAQIGLLLVMVIASAIWFIKRFDSVKIIIGIAVVSSFLMLIPIYSIVHWNTNNDYLFDVTDTENIIEGYSSGRYSIWKTTILSMKGHEIFGYGNSSNAWNKRKVFVSNYPKERTSEVYERSAIHKSQHNGYLALINEAGFVGAALFFVLLLSRIKNLKGRFREGQWEKLLLIYIFWINLFEAKYILHLFFTGYLMMILLLPPEVKKAD